MNSQDQEAVLACTLNDQDFKTRRALARKILLPHIIATDRGPDGLVLTFKDGPTRRADVENFIALERQCCAFLNFEIADRSPIEVTISGPAEAAATIDIFARVAEAARVPEKRNFRDRLTGLFRPLTKGCGCENR